MVPPARSPSRRSLLAAGAAGILTGCGVPPSDPGPGAGSTHPSAPGSSPRAGSGPTSTPTPTPSPTPTPTPTPEPITLPRGGVRLFPRTRLVGYCGHPGAPGQGRLGIGDPDDRVDELEDRYSDAYGPDRPVLPILELIAVSAHATAG